MSIIQKEIAKKALFRFLHIFGLTLLGGMKVSQALFYNDVDLPSNTENKMTIFGIILAMCMIIGGFVNFFILGVFKSKCDPKYYK